jgi:hypothetical protein
MQGCLLQFVDINGEFESKGNDSVLVTYASLLTLLTKAEAKLKV